MLLNSHSLYLSDNVDGMKVATYNCNSVRKRLPIIMAWLKKETPDVLALQGTKVQDIDFPEHAYMEAGYFSAFRGMKSYNGVAILTREKPSQVIYGFKSGADSEDFRIMQIVVRGIRIINTYVPQRYDTCIARDIPRNCNTHSGIFFAMLIAITEVGGTIF